MEGQLFETELLELKHCVLSLLVEVNDSEKGNNDDGC